MPAHEYFYWDNLTFDVTVARGIVSTRQPGHIINPAAVRNWIGEDEPVVGADGLRRAIIGRVNIDWQAARDALRTAIRRPAQVTLSPLIVANLAATAEDPLVLMPIDGFVDVWLAYKLERQTHPVHLLSWAETQTCKVVN